MRHSLLYLVHAASITIAGHADAQTEVWRRQLPSGVVRSIDAGARDNLGGTFLAGAVIGPSTMDVGIERFDSTGNHLWTRHFSLSDQDLVFGAAPDGVGGAYFTGERLDFPGTPFPQPLSSDAWLTRVDAAGNQLWLRRIRSTGDDRAYAVAADGTQGVFVVGTTFGQLGATSAGGGDAWIARCDSSGALLWIRQFGTQASDVARVAASDGQGGVVIAGTTTASLGGPSAGGQDIWMARYDSTGNRVWLRQFGTTQEDEVSGLVRTPSGALYVGGQRYVGFKLNTSEAWLARFDLSGTQHWERQLGSSAVERVYGLAADGDDGVILGGDTGGHLFGPHAGGGTDAWFARYGGNAELVWGVQDGTASADWVRPIGGDGAGGVLLAGADSGVPGGPSPGLLQRWLARYSDLGAVRHCADNGLNSTGLPSRLDGFGSPLASENDVTMVASQLPPNVTSLLLTSRAQAVVANPAGSQGTLCLGGAIGRYVGPGQLQQSTPSGTFDLTLDLAQHPTPSGLVPVAAGETWYFQVWHRDTVLGFQLSDFTDSLGVTFR